MKSLLRAGTISLGLALVGIVGAGAYTSNTSGTTLNGVLEALTDIAARLGYGTSVSTAQVSCATSATQALAADTSKVVRSVVNNSGSTVYLGGASVTTSNGVPIKDGQGFDASHFQGAFYCIVASATATIATIQY